MQLIHHTIHYTPRHYATTADSVDLLITGVEASLWLAEQFASDLRRIFPYLNVVTISANK